MRYKLLELARVEGWQGQLASTYRGVQIWKLTVGGGGRYSDFQKVLYAVPKVPALSTRSFRSEDEARRAIDDVV